MSSVSLTPSDRLLLRILKDNGGSLQLSQLTSESGLHEKTVYRRLRRLGSDKRIVKQLDKTDNRRIRVYLVTPQ